MKTLLLLLLLISGCHPGPAQIVAAPVQLGEFLIISWEHPPGVTGSLEWSFDTQDWHSLGTYSPGSDWAWHSNLFPASFSPVFFRASYVLPPAFAVWPEDAFPEAKGVNNP